MREHHDKDLESLLRHEFGKIGENAPAQAWRSPERRPGRYS